MPIELIDIPAAVATYIETQVMTTVSLATPKAHATIAGYGELSPSRSLRRARRGLARRLPLTECHEF